MASKEQIVQSIYAVIEDINLEIPENMKLKKSLNTILFGEGSSLDSLGLVNLVVASEQKILEDFDAPISISDERAISQKNSPFRTVETLVDYIGLLIEEQQNER